MIESFIKAYRFKHGLHYFVVELGTKIKPLKIYTKKFLPLLYKSYITIQKFGVDIFFFY